MKSITDVKNLYSENGKTLLNENKQTLMKSLVDELNDNIVGSTILHKGSTVSK